ncbi:MAG: nicotinate phosphoribosyltransferase [Myxococcales bacterium]|nr:nicotinate phosphoribosyltransferase [Myxococcales bacterium]MCB9565993.1 nicotinate phosphoribosyltransferase [Myxococcales bacterium]MCB9702826.1 nicotinate phosphoribosyltransferase [Myxococcales bacterium]
MSALNQLYGESLALLTDLYQVTMAYGYHRLGMSEHEAVFHLFFRRAPFKGGYAIAAGLDLVIDLIERLRFSEADLEYLGGLTGNDGRPLFDRPFLDHLAGLRFTCDVDAAPEGSVVFAHEPLLRIRGPIILCQLLETPLLNLINFSTLIATKSARICEAAGDGPVLEFGLRRAQGIDGSLSAARAAVIGGCAATSNCLAGRLYEIPVRGTHAHSWVMAFDGELEAFDAYAQAMPNNCVFLVDTYDTLEGVKHAVEIGKRLRSRGHEMVGVRLDSGDLRGLSVAARAILDEGGFPGATIVASNDLDEYQITELRSKGAAIGVWGVGTRLATAYDQPALGGVYKLAAIRGPGEPWSYRIKLSEEAIKISNPGIQQVRRFRGPDGALLGDLIYDEELGPSGDGVRIGGGEAMTMAGAGEDLLAPIFRGGARVYDSPSVLEMRERARAELASLATTTRRLASPTPYPVGLEARLHALRETLIARARGQERGAG